MTNKEAITNEDIQQAIKEGFANGYEMAKAKFERPQGELLKELWNCRNELCLKCGEYHNAHKGACEDCRYNFENMKKWGERE